jgi:hypothetical protein
VEHRSSTRFAVQVPVLFSWLGSSSRIEHSGGFSRNLGKGGAFVCCGDSIPPVGAELSIEVLLSGLGSECKQWRLHGKARVVRIESRPKGFAVLMEEPYTDVLGEEFV